MAKSKSEEFNERMRARLTPQQNSGAEVVQRLKESARRRRERRI